MAKINHTRSVWALMSLTLIGLACTINSLATDETTTLRPAATTHEPAYIEASNEVNTWYSEASAVMAGLKRIDFRSKQEEDIYLMTYAYLTKIALMQAMFHPHVRDGLSEPAINVGTNWSPREPVGANLNNYAPDGFSDLELMRLFGLGELVREGKKLASERKLGESGQSGLNVKLLDTYVKSMLAHPPAREYQSSESSAEATNENCVICLNEHESKQWVELPCKHRLHADCAANWNIVQSTMSSCPVCRALFRMPVREPIVDETD